MTDVRAVPKATEDLIHAISDELLAATEELRLLEEDKHGDDVASAEFRRKSEIVQRYAERILRLAQRQSRVAASVPAIEQGRTRSD